jgi:hypothetical protein
MTVTSASWPPFVLSISQRSGRPRTRILAIPALTAAILSDDGTGPGGFNIMPVMLRSRPCRGPGRQLANAASESSLQRAGLRFGLSAHSLSPPAHRGAGGGRGPGPQAGAGQGPSELPAVSRTRKVKCKMARCQCPFLPRPGPMPGLTVTGPSRRCRPNTAVYSAGTLVRYRKFRTLDE